MTIEQKVRGPYIKKLTVWLIIVAILSAVAFLYHLSGSAAFEPIVTAALIAVIAAIIFYAMNLGNYFFDKSFSGEIVSIKTSVRRIWPSAFERRSVTRVVLEISVSNDNGKAEYFEEILPAAITGKIPYAVGDRVYHIKGAKHTCRFPRNDTEKKYAPISVICPICGAIMSLGKEECDFCGSDLPWDPAVK